MGVSTQGKEERRLPLCHFPRGGTHIHTHKCTRYHGNPSTALRLWGPNGCNEVSSRELFLTKCFVTLLTLICSYTVAVEKPLLVHLLVSRQNKCVTSKVHVSVHPKHIREIMKKKKTVKPVSFLFFSRDKLISNKLNSRIFAHI